MSKPILTANASPKLAEVSKLLNTISVKWDVYAILRDIFECMAIAIDNQTSIIKNKRWHNHEENYKSIMNKYAETDRQTLVEIVSKIFDILISMHKDGFDDYLGKLYMMSGTSSGKAGQFFTPYNVSFLCAQTAIEKLKVEEAKREGKIITLYEPTCGSGGMILAAADRLLNDFDFNYAEQLVVCCGDIDVRCVHMAYIQLSLAGIPAIIKHQNGLTFETWDVWETPAYKMNYLKFANLRSVAK